jgi:hypothetical protein
VRWLPFKVHIFAAAFPLLLSFAILVGSAQGFVGLRSVYVLWPERPAYAAEPFSGRPASI